MLHATDVTKLQIHFIMLQKLKQVNTLT